MRVAQGRRPPGWGKQKRGLDRHASLAMTATGLRPSDDAGGNPAFALNNVTKRSRIVDRPQAVWAVCIDRAGSVTFGRHRHRPFDHEDDNDNRFAAAALTTIIFRHLQRHGWMCASLAHRVTTLAADSRGSILFSSLSLSLSLS
ncbi:MAG: hypothetical protein AB1568_01930 [Thermodesulfobacteriota bacterium]